MQVRILSDCSEEHKKEKIKSGHGRPWRRLCSGPARDGAAGDNGEADGLEGCLGSRIARTVWRIG